MATMRKSDVKRGDRLTITAQMAAERMGKCTAKGCILCNQSTYPNYKQIQPGMVGTVASVDVPAVTVNKSFLCLDFQIDGHVWRTRPWYHEVRAI